MISKIDKNKVRLKRHARVRTNLSDRYSSKATFKRISFKQAYLRSNY